MTDRTEMIKKMTKKTIEQYGGALSELAKGADEEDSKEEFHYCKELSGPKPLLTSYARFFDGLIKLGFHGTCYIPEAPTRDRFVLDENSTNFIVVLSENSVENTSKFDKYTEKFTHEISQNKNLTMIYPSLSYDDTERKGTIHFDF